MNPYEKYQEDVIRWSRTPREQAEADYGQCQKAGVEAYEKAILPMKAYRDEVLGIERSLRECMETAQAALRPLVDVMAVAEAQARKAYKEAFEEEKNKLKRR